MDPQADETPYGDQRRVNAARIHMLESRVWFGYRRAIDIRDQLERLLVYPKTHRMPNLAIIGESNNGKTMLLENFERRHAPDKNPELDRAKLRVLMIQTPPDPDELRLYSALLERLMATGALREPADIKLSRLQRLLRELDTRMLVLDEFHHALAGSATRQRKFLNALKYLGNELRIPIVLAGIPEGLNALQIDPQIANRFEPTFLPRWTAGEEYDRLLATAESVLGLRKASNLPGVTLSKKILEESEGLIGEMMRLLRSLAKQAIETGDERITIDSMSKENLRALKWRRPSERARYVA
jgi:hypothetical protein